MINIDYTSSRTLRQLECVKCWLKSKGRGTIIAPTGTGKTVIALLALQKVLTKYPTLQVLVVVPTTTLKDQWTKELDEWGFSLNCKVEVINTVIKGQYKYDILVIDEAHRVAADTFQTVFKCVHYKLILCLTATLERLDGKHEIIESNCPVVDEISQLETVMNGWVAPYREYEVLVNVDDIDEYKKMNKEFQMHFEFFNFDFNLAISCCGKDGWKNKLRYRDELYKGNDEKKKKEIMQMISYHAAGLMRTMQQRKAFINNHPKKIELARKIIEAREGKKILTFSNSVKMAEAIGIGAVYTGKDSKKKGRMTLEEFSDSNNINVLNSCNKLDEGLNVPGISVGIIIGTNSSEIKARQRRGRTIRAQDGKLAEIFYIIINDTVETSWFKKSHSRDSNFIVIDEEGLNDVLEGKTPRKAKEKPAEFVFRF